MAAVQRKIDADVAADNQSVEPQASIVEIIPTTIARTSPFRSPAKDLQESLAQRLAQPETKPRNDVLYGLVAGVLGATWLTSILIYAAL